MMGAQPSHVNIGELSAGLGLPYPKIDRTTRNTATRSRTIAPNQVPPNAVYGRLMDKALDQPLTADTLAQYFGQKTAISNNWLGESPNNVEALRGFEARNHSFEPTTPAARRSRNLNSQLPRQISEAHDPVTPTSTERSQATYNRRHSSSNYSATPVEVQARHSADRRHPRAITRTKRLDQGPEPSSADIYPDDANWVPTGRYGQRAPGQFSSYFVPQLSPRRELHVEDALDWPTPAEVYKPGHAKPSAPMAVQAYSQPTGDLTHEMGPTSPIDIFDQHVPPTAEDIHAEDDEVLAMMNELPHPSMRTLVNFNALDLVCDERPLTPGQVDGSRYGLKFHGLAVNDTWECAKVDENDPFRVRPRNHDGWGGWEWAVKKGWADD